MSKHPQSTEKEESSQIQNSYMKMKASKISKHNSKENKNLPAYNYKNSLNTYKVKNYFNTTFVCKSIPRPIELQRHGFFKKNYVNIFKNTDEM